MNWQPCTPLQRLAESVSSARRTDDGRMLLVRTANNVAETQNWDDVLARLGRVSHLGVQTPEAWRMKDDALELAFRMPDGESLEDSLHRGLPVRALFNIVSDVVDAAQALRRAGIDQGGFDAWSIWRMRSESGLLLAPNPVPSPSPNRLKTDFERNDLQRLGRLIVSILRGSDAFSLPPAPSEGDIARLLQPSDHCLAPVLVPLMAGESGERALAEFKDAISVLELKSEWPARSVNTGLVSVAEVRRALSRAPRIANVATRARHGRARRQIRSGLGVGGLFISLLILLASGTAVLYMSPRAQDVFVSALRDVGVLPEPFSEGIEGLLAQGADNGNGLAVRVGAYRSVLARAPGHGQATAELRQLIAGTREEIGAALADGRLDVVNQRLGEALNLFPQDAEFRRQFDELSERRMAENLFVNTLTLVEEGDLSDDEALTAVEAYREVLRLWPAHEGTRNALQALARYFADKAQESLLGNDIASAMTFLGHATVADSEIDAVTGVRAQIQRETDLRQAVESLLEAGASYLASGALVNPPAENAAETYVRVLASDPGNPIATEGLRQVTSGVIDRIDRAITARDYALASSVLARALQIALDEGALADVATRLEVEQAKSERVRVLLRQAEQHLADGYITAPEDGNLLAELFEVLTLDPDNARALVLRERAAERLAEVAEDAWRADFAEDAREYLRVALTLAPDNQAWIEKRDLWSSTPSN